MLPTIFLPEQINSFYLFTQRIVAVEIASRHLYVTVVRAHRRKKTIEKFIELPYDPLEPDSLLQAIARLLQEIGSYEKFFIALPSSLAIYKNLVLPFTSIEKIKLVVPFEIESLLPFALQEATIDLVVNNINKQEKNSSVFIASIRQNILNTGVQPFLIAGIQPDKVTVGGVELYGLIKKTGTIPDEGVCAVVHFNQSTTSILLVINGALKYIRVLPEGISEEMMRMDFNNASHESAHVTKFFNAIQFTLQATLKSELGSGNVSKIIVSGSGTKISDFTAYVGRVLGCPAVPFQLQSIVHAGDVVLEPGINPAPEFTVSLATALGSTQTDDFNLGRTYSAPREIKQFRYQVITGGTLLALMIGMIIIYGFFNVRSLKKEASLLTNQVSQELSRTFGLEPKKATVSLSLYLQNAERKLNEEESIWFALSHNQRFSYLKYLEELSSAIHREKTGLHLKRLSIKSGERSAEDTMIIEGSVDGYEELDNLQDALMSTNLFRNIPSLQELKFTIPLTINKNPEGGV